MATELLIVRWVHLVAAATWLGGLITLAAVVVTLRREGVDRSVLQAAARQFARLSWGAIAVAVVTGVLQVMWMHLPWSYGRLHVKLTVVGLAIAVAAVHQFTARNASAAVRGMQQGLIMLLSLGIFAAAVAL